MADDKDKNKKKLRSEDISKKLIFAAIGLAATMKLGDGKAVDNFKIQDREEVKKEVMVSSMPSENLKKQVDPQAYEATPDTFKIFDSEREGTRMSEEKDRSLPEPETYVIDGYEIEETTNNPTADRGIEDNEPVDFSELKESLKETELETAREFIGQYDDYKNQQKEGASKADLIDNREEMMQTAFAVEAIQNMQRVVPAVEKALNISNTVVGLADAVVKYGPDSEEYKKVAGDAKKEAAAMKKDTNKLMRDVEKGVATGKRMQDVGKVAIDDIGSKKVTNYLEDMYSRAKDVVKPIDRAEEKTKKQENRAEEKATRQENRADEKAMRQEDGSSKDLKKMNREFEKEEKKENRSDEAQMKKEHGKGALSVKDLFNKRGGRQ